MRGPIGMLYATSCTNETNLFEDWLNFIRASQRKSLPPAVHVVNLVFINMFKPDVSSRARPAQRPDRAHLVPKQDFHGLSSCRYLDILNKYLQKIYSGEHHIVNNYIQLQHQTLMIREVATTHNWPQGEVGIGIRFTWDIMGSPNVSMLRPPNSCSFCGVLDWVLYGSTSLLNNPQPSSPCLHGRTYSWRQLATIANPVPIPQRDEVTQTGTLASKEPPPDMRILSPTWRFAADSWRRLGSMLDIGVQVWDIDLLHFGHLYFSLLGVLPFQSPSFQNLRKTVGPRNPLKKMQWGKTYGFVKIRENMGKLIPSSYY